MSDLLLLGLTGGLTLLLLLTLLAFAGCSGLLAGVTFHVGPCGETGPLFTESCSVSPKLRSVACRCAVGSILSEGEESPSSELIRLYQKFGFKVFSFPAPSHVVTATFPYPPPCPSGWLPAGSILPWMPTSRSGSCQDQIYFMCPLARQGDFYVPEVKKTERKSRGPAEANDAPLGPGSREASAATLSPGVSTRGWDDGDTRSEHSYSESGASGSSFEELDLEGEGALGEPRLSPETEPLGAPKWPWEPSTPERGEE
ncbi:hypothetical protein FD755_016478 [Muntiacus reevesi]|uniref:Uncharacterized protein n=1 Tax=Muntiacus reevesi TaxID=9886 RepID=A0A5N3XCZ2_MUNRE|nr:hypothetical protein FD755_016478 [Muntiacus reevesi]